MALFARKCLAAGALLLDRFGAQERRPRPRSPRATSRETAKGNAARATLSVNLARDAASPAVAATNLKNAVKLAREGRQGRRRRDQRVRARRGAQPLGEPARHRPHAEARCARLHHESRRPRSTFPATLDSLFKIVEAAQPELLRLHRVLARRPEVLSRRRERRHQRAERRQARFGRVLRRRRRTALLAVALRHHGARQRRQQEEQQRRRPSSTGRKAAEAASKDTTYRDVRRQMLAQHRQRRTWTQANTRDAVPRRSAAARKAADTYEQLLAMPGTTGSYVTRRPPEAPDRLPHRRRHRRGGEDRGTQLLANPSAYEYQDLLNSAVNAARANRVRRTPASCSRRRSPQNPYSRDALYNVAVTYLTLEQNEKVGPIVTRLVAVDPGNPENYNLAARAYLSMAKARRRRRRRRSPAAYNDTTVHVVQQRQQAAGRSDLHASSRRATSRSTSAATSSIVATRSDANSRALRRRAKGAKGKPAPKAAAPPKTLSAEVGHADVRGARQGGAGGRYGDGDDRAARRLAQTRQVQGDDPGAERRRPIATRSPSKSPSSSRTKAPADRRALLSF